MAGLKENIVAWSATNMQFTFGKFKGKTVEYVFNHQPSYLAWAVGQNLIELDKKTEKKLIRYMEMENKESKAILDSVFRVDQYDEYEGFDENHYGQI